MQHQLTFTEDKCSTDVTLDQLVTQLHVTCSTPLGVVLFATFGTYSTLEK